MMKIATHNQNGFTLVEALVYVSVLVVVSVGAITLLLQLHDLFQNYKTQKMLFDSSMTAVERITTEIRDADSVDGSSILTVKDSELTLVNDTNVITFLVTNGNLLIYRNDILQGQLTQDQINVDHFFVYHYTNAETELVRVRMHLTASTSASAVSQEIDVAAVLRETYAP